MALPIPNESLWEKAKGKYAEKEKQIGDEAMRTYERIIMLNIIDAQWKDHLLALDHLKQGIGLRGYGQKDPLVEYKKESFHLFQDMMDRIEDETIRYLFFLQRADCFIYSGIYRSGLGAFGGSAYNERQTQFCQCCP